MKLLKIVVFLTVVTSLAGADAGNKGLVTGSRLNVRTKPMASGEVVCQLLKGEPVNIQELKGHWAAVDIPPKCQAWIQTSALSGSTVTTATNAHLGPTAVFTQIGTLEKGDTVTSLRTKGNWTLVRAQFRGRLWVHSDYITLPPGMKRPVVVDTVPGKVPHKTGSGSGEVVNVSSKNPTGDVPSKPIIPPSDMVVHEMGNEVLSTEIVPLSTAKRVTKSGVIVKLKDKEGRAFKYALASQINNRFYPLFYLRDTKNELNKWELHRVTIVGDRQWVKGYPRPVVEVSSVVPEKK